MADNERSELYVSIVLLQACLLLHTMLYRLLLQDLLAVLQPMAVGMRMRMP